MDAQAPILHDTGPKYPWPTGDVSRTAQTNSNYISRSFTSAIYQWAVWQYDLRKTQPYRSTNGTDAFQ